MGLENKVHEALMGVPVVKKVVKRAYQGVSVATARPKKVEGKAFRITPNDEYEYLFGYYDKSPWDKSGRYMLALRVKDASKNVAPGTEAEIVLIDTENNNLMRILAKTRTWNVQQGCMSGWLGPNFDKEIFYNDLRNGKYRGVILNIETGEERLLDGPVYSVSNDGKTALSLDFSRLHRLRPGYGYSNLKDKTEGQKVPGGACVWKIDMKTGGMKPILTYQQLYDFEHRKDMEGAEHKVNHLMLSPNGKRFMVIHRWLNGGKKMSRLLTCSIDGSGLYNLADENMVSHCYWKNDEEILAYCRRGGENGYYLMKDKTTEFSRKWEWLTADGHPSYSPDGNFVVTDTYPNRKRICTLKVLSETASFVLAKVYAPFKYDNDVRCDLHPRWSRDGKKICFDGCFEGKREVYVVEVPENIRKVAKLAKKPNGKIKIMYLMTSCRKSGPTEQTLNIIKNLDRSVFDPILVTIYEEGLDSQINNYLPYVSEHHVVLMSKKSIMMKKTQKMKSFLSKINPDIIHSAGVFPNYLISTIGFKNHVFTLRNYAREDYLAKFGKIKGRLLVKMQISAIKNTDTVVSCSKSLQKMYLEKLGIKTKCVQNGVDTEKYIPMSIVQKNKMRKKLGIDEGDFVWVYSGQFIERKNIPFMIDGFLRTKEDNEKMLLLGGGEQLSEIKRRYGNEKSLIFTGAVDKVKDYLSAGDVYISASRSEGLPNGVLEALAMGLPVLLSNIPQHEEILKEGGGGVTFRLDDMDNHVRRIREIRKGDVSKMSVEARRNVEENFSSNKMSGKYQEIYKQMIGEKTRITLFISSLSGGGAERVTCNLANYLSKSGYAVDVITMSNRRDVYKLNDKIRRICLLDEKERAGKVHDLRLRQKRLKQYLIENQDVACYVVMLPIPIFMLIRLKKYINGKIVISERINPASHRFANKMIMAYSVKKCDCLVVQTKEIAEWYGNVKNKVTISNAINEDVVFPERGHIDKKIVAVGRLEKQKNYPMMIKAFKMFSDKHPEYVLEIYGEGSQGCKLKRMVERFGLADKVRFLGYVSNVSERIADASCFVMTSNFEGMPNALIEAMCIGLPCIAVDCDGGGAEELIDSGVNGVLIKKNDVNGTASTMAKIVEDPVFAQKISVNALRMREKLDSDKIYGKWASTIREVLEKK